MGRKNLRLLQTYLKVSWFRRNGPVVLVLCMERGRRGRREEQQEGELPLGETLFVCMWVWVCVSTQDNFLLYTKTVFVTSTHVRSKLPYNTYITLYYPIIPTIIYRAYYNLH